MPQRIVLDRPLTWRQVAVVAGGGALALSGAAQSRILAAHALVQAIVHDGVRAYGVNTGVGALCDVVIATSQQERLSRNIVMSHAVGVGPPLERTAVRAIIAAAINNFSHGFSGVRPAVADRVAASLQSRPPARRFVAPAATAFSRSSAQAGPSCNASSGQTVARSRRRPPSCSASSRLPAPTSASPISSPRKSSNSFFDARMTVAALRPQTAYFFSATPLRSF